MVALDYLNFMLLQNIVIKRACCVELMNIYSQNEILMTRAPAHGTDPAYAAAICIACSLCGVCVLYTPAHGTDPTPTRAARPCSRNGSLPPPCPTLARTRASYCGRVPSTY